MGYKNDIFVSYAHLDNRPLCEGDQGWVSEFHRLLEIRLGELLGRKPKLYRDQKLAGNDEFGEELVDRVADAALFLSILTPPYINSEWCMRELLAFCEVATKQTLPGNKSRIFKVLKTPVAPDCQPGEVRSTLGFEFCTADPGTGVARELRLRVNGQLQDEFLARLADLAHHLSKAILQTGDGTVTAEDDNDRAVYLAEPSSDLRETHDRIKRDLLENGFKVFPEKSLPDEITELDVYLDEALQRCCMSIHLIGKNYGVVPDGTDKSRVTIQAELAGKRAATGQLARLIWMPDELKVDDPRQQAVIEQLRTDPNIQQGDSDLLTGSVEDLLTQVYAVLRRPPAKAAPPVAPGDAIPSVYVMCDERDTDNVEGIADTLVEHGCEVSLPEFGAEEAEFREFNTGMLTRCDAALVYYGAGNRNWLEQKLQELRRVPALKRGKPLSSTQILVNAPRTWRGRFPNAHVVHTSENTGNLVDPLLADLGRT